MNAQDPESQRARLDYAWNWFNFHAEQRTKMFNYMLIGLGVVTTAIATTLQKAMAAESMILSVAAMLICVAFYQMDRRNRHLYDLAQEVLLQIEKDRLFEQSEPGIVKALETETARGRSAGWAEGEHRYWMPTVTWIFAALFGCAFLRAYDMSRNPAAYSDSDRTAVVCCQASNPSPGTAGSPGTPGSGAVPHPNVQSGSNSFAAEGTGRISSFHYWLPVGLGLVLAVGGALLFIKGRRPLGSALVAAGLATSALPNISVPIHAEFHLDPNIEGKIESDVELKLEGLLDVFHKLRPPQPVLVAAAPFSGFAEGSEAFDCKSPANLEPIDTINGALREAKKQNLQPVVLMVGGTDRKPLSASLRAKYGGNSGLARKRVDAVAQCLMLELKSDQNRDTDGPEVLRLVTGPGYTPKSAGTREAEGGFAEDREVEVLVIATAARKTDAARAAP